MAPAAFVYVTIVFELGFRPILQGGGEHHSLSSNQALLVGGVGGRKGMDSVPSLVGSSVVLELLVPAFYLD